jgi:hypothetical protein
MESASQDVAQHLARMRRTWWLFLGTVPAAIGVAFVLPRLQSEAASPFTVTLLALVGTLWIALTAERDARARLDRAKRAFAAHGDTNRLLRDHWLVFLIVLVRLEIVVLCCVLISVWGVGRGVGVCFAVLGGLLMLLSRPTEAKARLLIERAEELRDPR